MNVVFACSCNSRWPWWSLIVLLASPVQDGAIHSDSKAIGGPADYVALNPGQRWSYRITTGDSVRTFAARCEGGDYRTLDGKRTRYQFVYGSTDGIEGDVVKSIYAMPDPGPREYFVDDFAGGVLHDPPVQLLPEKIVEGAKWEWSGKLDVHRRPLQGTVQLEILAIEEKDIAGQSVSVVSTREALKDGTIIIQRWFVRDLGLVHFSVKRRDDDGVMQSVTEIVLDRR